MIAQFLVGKEIECVLKMGCLHNTRRVWLMPKVCWDAGYRPLAEAAAPKDRWITSGGVEALTYPPVPDTMATTHAATLFSGELQMIRTSNSEVPGG
jgi:hypothetical protein